MGIQPIDLQTMYSQLTNVSKSLAAGQQAQLTEAMQQQQNIQRGLENASKVQQTQTEKTDTALVNKDGSLTEIAQAFKSKFSEVYTDEYQDTSFVQESLLQAISRDNNRFMVGDIKQSIYGFRQARPDIFNKKYIEYKRNDECSQEDKEAKIILAQNFRSREEVIDSINYIFEKIMSMKNGECNYTSDETLKCGNKSYVNSEDTSFKTEINIINLKEQESIPLIGDETEDDEYEIDENLSDVQIEAKCVAYKIQDIVKMTE